MHGITHVPGGPDPIPGLDVGGGGGALEWSDVGGPGTPPVAGMEWARYAVYAGYSVDGSGRVLWSTNVANGQGKLGGYDPANEVVAVDPTNPWKLLTLSAGLYQVQASFAGIGQSTDVALFLLEQTNVSGFGTACHGVATMLPSSTVYGNTFGNVTGWFRRQASLITGTYVALQLGYLTGTSPVCTICVTKLGPYP